MNCVQYLILFIINKTEKNVLKFREIKTKKYISTKQKGNKYKMTAKYKIRKEKISKKNSKRKNTKKKLMYASKC